MSLKNGLNIKKSTPLPTRRPILDDDDDDEGDVDARNGGQGGVEAEDITTFGGGGSVGPARPTSKATVKKADKPTGAPSLRNKTQDDRQDLSSAQAARSHVKAAEEVDPSIFDYDNFHDAKSMVSEARKAAARQDAIDRKPKYINNLLDAAAKRKQDQTIAREKLLQKEREAEGDEFADKEKFVTGAYKEQQEETRRLEEEEKKRAEEEEKRRRQNGGGMQGFYRGIMAEQEKQHQEAVEAAARIEREGGVQLPQDAKAKTDLELAAELQAKGVNVHVNEDGQVTDKRDLLSAGLNVNPSGRSKDSLATARSQASSRPAQSAFAPRNDGGKQAQRERQSRMMEEQLAAQAKRAREEEEEERAKMEKAAKSTKTSQDVSDAKARYLARKAAKERGEG